MKKSTMHSTKTKKSYNKPVLRQIGNVALLTKADKSGSRTDDINPAITFGNN